MRAAPRNQPTFDALHQESDLALPPSIPTTTQPQQNASSSEDVPAAPPFPCTPKDPMTPFYAVILCLLIGAGCLPVAMKLMKENNKRLADEATFGRNPEGVGEPVSKRAGPRGGGTSDKLARVGDAGEESPSMPRLSPEEVHERVWYKLQEVQKFLSAEGVAKLAKLDLEQTREELQMLAKDGYLEVGRDKSGRPIYRILEEDGREA